MATHLYVPTWAAFLYLAVVLEVMSATQSLSGPSTSSHRPPAPIQIRLLGLIPDSLG
jgi:hypothetical protein